MGTTEEELRVHRLTHNVVHQFRAKLVNQCPECNYEVTCCASTRQAAEARAQKKLLIHIRRWHPKHRRDAHNSRSSDPHWNAQRQKFECPECKASEGGSFYSTTEEELAVHRLTHNVGHQFRAKRECPGCKGFKITCRASTRQVAEAMAQESLSEHRRDVHNSGPLAMKEDKSNFWPYISVAGVSAAFVGGGLMLLKSYLL